MKNIHFFSVIFALIFTASSCNESQEVVPSSLSPDVVSALHATLDDEYKAQATYQRILSDFGSETRPFVNIFKAEVKHAESIAGIMEKYGIDVPKNNFKVSDMPTFQSVAEACALGVIAEEENIAIYDRYFALDLPADVQQVFTSNRSASLNNHLPAFENCSK